MSSDIFRRYIDVIEEAQKPGVTEGLNEFAQTGGGDSGDYLKSLASAWYYDTFETGSLQKGIKSQEDVERLLARGIVCPDGKVRKYEIGYNNNFDGVDIYSDDYYEHGDESGKLDSRTGKPFGPYEFISFSDDELDDDVDESQQGVAEMDSQGYTGSRDRKKTSKYGSRDHYDLGGPESTGRPLTAKQMMDRAHKAMLKSMSNDEKVDKGWRNPNVDEGVAEGSRLRGTGNPGMPTPYDQGRDDAKKGGAYDNPYTHPGEEQEHRQYKLGYEQGKKPGVAEAAGNIGNSIKALYQKIYRAGDDEIEYFYNDSPIFAQYWDEYEGDLDSIIAEVNPAELQIIHDELASYVDQANLAEVSDATLTSYLTKVDADARKHRADPTKRSAEKRNKSVAGFARAFNKLDARREKVDEIDPNNYDSDEDYYRDLEAGRYQGVPKKPYNPDWDADDDAFMQKWYEKHGLKEGKTFKDYVAEAEYMAENPVTGDYFAINVREDTLLETWICEETQDGIVLHADDTMMNLLEGYGWLESQESNDGDYTIDSDEDEVDVVDQGEYDQEGDMAKDDLHTIIRAAQRLNGMLDDNENMPEWVQSKITKAADYVDTAADYIESNKEQEMDEAKYQGREVPLGKPMRGDVKKSKVYVKGPKGNVVKVNFGDPDMKIKKSNPARRKSFRARHNCENPGPRWKARYWSCRAW